ncbi:hypothetical protein [Halobaculum sp. D14]|uniref:hypothetical protein n=1 Tax=Halobaculum sp. D14 TaxID=3421642 RepID=UPI003EB6FA0C
MSDEIDDRLSRRFGEDEKAGDESQTDNQSQTDMSSQTSQKEQTGSEEQNEKKAQKAQNIKKEWNVRSFYLPDDVDDELTTAYKRLDFELSEAGAGVDLKKTRHFYPLLVELGLERLAEMDTTEVTERLESTD